jgi:hypothetical protein
MPDSFCWQTDSVYNRCLMARPDADVAQLTPDRILALGECPLDLVGYAPVCQSDLSDFHTCEQCLDIFLHEKEEIMEKRSEALADKLQWINLLNTL